MQIGTIEESPRNAAKAAGLAGLVSFAIIAFVEFGIYRRLVTGDPILASANAAETARNISAHQQLFRVGIALDLSYCAGVAVVVGALYVILRPFGRTVALVAAVGRTLFAGAWFLATADLFDTVRLLGGGSDLRAFGEGQVQALAALPLSIRWDHY